MRQSQRCRRPGGWCSPRSGAGPGARLTSGQVFHGSGAAADETASRFAGKQLSAQPNGRLSARVGCCARRSRAVSRRRVVLPCNRQDSTDSRQRIGSPLLRSLASPPLRPPIEHRPPDAVLDRCSVAAQVTDTSWHTTALRSDADLRKRHQPARPGPRRHDRVRALNPRVRGSSPWRRTHGKPLTCTFAADKVV
jgi:hypothetical protein